MTIKANQADALEAEAIRPETAAAMDGATLAQTVARLSRELAQLRSEVARLDADLDESRRLNLRAAELLDIIYEQASKR